MFCSAERNEKPPVAIYMHERVQAVEKLKDYQAPESAPSPVKSKDRNLMIQSIPTPAQSPCYPDKENEHLLILRI